MADTPDVCNIAAFLPQLAASQPYAPAVVFPHGRDPNGKVSYTHYTFAQLDRESDVIAAGLTALGVGQGVRTALMVKPSLEFFALTFGIFKAGAVPILVDPGIGLKNLKTCLGEAEPEAFIGIPAAHAARIALGWSRDSIRTLVTVGRKLFWGGHTLAAVRAAGAEQAGWRMAETAPDSMAAVLFTSGSTGVPKGAEYVHETFVRQVEMIRDTYGIEPGEIDLPTFPLFALFDPALGMTTIVPDMDFTRPAQVDPKKIVEAVRDFGVTNMFGSPALLNTVGRYGEANGVELPSLRRVISAGAPVPAQVMRRFLKMLPEDAEVVTPYGATEVLPVASISSTELAQGLWDRTDRGEGVCVGRPVAPNRVSIIGIDDEAIETWSEDLVAPHGEVGEVCVKGPTVTRRYHNREASTRLAKIHDAEGDGITHRMGDLGYFDDEGRLWFCGRKAHRVETPAGTRFSVQCEAVFNTHRDVYRSALVGVDGEPVIVVELEPGASASAALNVELLALATQHAHTADIRRVLYHPGFPVDIRHNAKINRGQLAEWARGKGG